MHWQRPSWSDLVKWAFGAIAIGFGFILIVAVTLVIISPDEGLSTFMKFGAYVWGALSILSHPISKRLLNIKRR
ncbi:MAG: hypothetical protein AMS18_08780 [Gemmatimonas sp. SG8_17]|nr:MAG: hypothetical protein AMS18_08780 [Gemmatimonas sp. SG8_17]